MKKFSCCSLPKAPFTWKKERLWGKVAINLAEVFSLVAAKQMPGTNCETFLNTKVKTYINILKHLSWQM